MSLTNRGDVVGDSAETIATLCRKYREEGSLADAQAALRRGFAAHPRDVRLLVERVLLDDLSEQQQGRCPRNVTQSRPSVEIILCVYNALDDTKRCLDSIQSKTTYPYSLTIIDDASAAEVRDYLNAFAASRDNVRVFSNSENLGYSRSTNRGLKEAHADWVVLLNSDTVVTTGWLEGLIDCAISDEVNAAVGPLSNVAGRQTIATANDLSLSGGPEQMAALTKQVAKNLYPQVPVLIGFCTLVSLPALKEIGNLDATNFPGYQVDVDMSLRLLSAGHKLRIAEDVYVHHGSGTSFGKGEKRDRLLAEGGQRLAEIWPGCDRDAIRHAVDSSLKDIKKAISKELKGRAKKKQQAKPANRILRALLRYTFGA
jgi:GT2 family glycosyltransferase